MTKALAIVRLGMVIVALIVSIPSDWMIVGPGETGDPLVEPVEWTPSTYDGPVLLPILATDDIPGDIYTNVVQEDNYVTNGIQGDIYELRVETWACPEHGRQWRVIIVNKQAYCEECWYDKLVKLLELKPIKHCDDKAQQGGKAGG